MMKLENKVTLLPGRYPRGAVDLKCKKKFLQGITPISGWDASVRADETTQKMTKNNVKDAN